MKTIAYGILLGVFVYVFSDIAVAWVKGDTKKKAT